MHLAVLVVLKKLKFSIVRDANFSKSIYQRKINDSFGNTLNDEGKGMSKSR